MAIRKFSLSGDEWYPVMSLIEVREGYEIIELTDEEISDLERVSREFQGWQRRLMGEDEDADAWVREFTMKKWEEVL